MRTDLRDYIHTVLSFWSFFINLNDLCEYHISSNCQQRQARRQLCLFRRTLFSHGLSLRITMQLFTSRNCCAVMWLNYLLPSKLVANISCPVMSHILLSPLSITYSIYSDTFLFYVHCNFIGKPWWVLVKIVLWWGSSPILVIFKLGPFRSRLWDFKDMRVYSILARWLRVRQ